MQQAVGRRSGLPEQTPELVLSPSRQQISNLATCPVAVCTRSLEAQVGQEGIGETHQMQVYNCRQIGSGLVLTQLQQQLQVFHLLLIGKEEGT
jgi:hypothetical protein